MTIYNLGSINLDHVYEVQSLPIPGETVFSTSYMRNIGGKGLNISVAAQRFGGHVRHIGQVGAGDTAIRALLDEVGITAELIRDVDAPTGHAIIYVDAESENCIVVHGGANQSFQSDFVGKALQDAGPGDWLVLQNETNANAAGIALARQKGMKIALVAAPFCAQSLPEQISHVDLVTMNQTELSQFEAATGTSPADHPHVAFLITLGAKGARFLHEGKVIDAQAYKVQAVDTTGAGDTFFGAFLAQYAKGEGVQGALSIASAAGALMVQRKGAANVIPTLDEAEAFLGGHSDL